MDGKKARPQTKTEPNPTRAERLAAALRDNLKKRKSQARERKSLTTGAAPDIGSDDAIETGTEAERDGRPCGPAGDGDG